MSEIKQSEIVSKACRDIERRIGQAVTCERQTRMTNLMMLLHGWYYTNEAIAEAIMSVFYEQISPAAVKMRVRAWKKREAEARDA